MLSICVWVRELAVFSLGWRRIWFIVKKLASVLLLLRRKREPFKLVNPCAGANAVSMALPLPVHFVTWSLRRVAYSSQKNCLRIDDAKTKKENKVDQGRGVN